MNLPHGSILCGVIAVPDVDAALEDYRDRLGLELLGDQALDADLAASWGCPASAGSRMAVLRPQSGAACYIRLVEQAIPTGFVPTTTYGWAAYELTVQDVFGWPDRIVGGGFDIVGPPAEIEGLPYFIAMQVHGTGKEMLYLNETHSNTPSSDLPRAQSPIDRIFIAVLAARDHVATVNWYRDRLALEEGETYVKEYLLINEAFGLPAGTTSSLTLVQKGRMPIIEVDEYPPQTGIRPREPGRLPPGNALITLAVDSLDACRCEWIAPPAVREGPVYESRRAATMIGPSGELLELVEAR